MLMRIAELVVLLAEAYVVLGGIFVVLFMLRAAARMDPGLATAPVTMRLLIVPGLVAFWPLFAARWVSGATPPVERNAHRDKAGRLSGALSTPVTRS